MQERKTVCSWKSDTNVVVSTDSVRPRSLTEANKQESTPYLLWGNKGAEDLEKSVLFDISWCPYFVWIAQSMRDLVRCV